VGLQGALPEFERLGAGIFAVTADSAQGVLQAIDEWRLSFVVVLDAERKAIWQYGLLNPVNGLALPSTFLIDRQGIVRHRYVGTSSADRPDAQEVLEAVRKLVGAAKP
jgi:peroxiredoxin